MNAQPNSSTLKTRNSPTRLPNNLHITTDNATYTVPTNQKYIVLEDPVFIDSGIPPVTHPVKNPSQRNTMTVEFLRTNPNFKANLPFLYMTPTTYKFCFPLDRNIDH